MEYHSLHIIGSRTSGGAERFYSRLAIGLHARACTVLAVNPARSAVALEIADAAPQHHIRMRNVWDPLARWQLKRLIAREQPRIVQTYMGRATRLVNLPANGPSIHIARLGGFYDVKGYQHAHAWVGNTRGICDYLVNAGLPSDRIFHISNFVDPVDNTVLRSEHFRTQHNIAADSAIVLFVGRLHPNKGVSDLLNAFSILRKKQLPRRAHLVIVGDGPLQAELHAQATQLGLHESMTWAGWVDRPEVYYANADLFVCPSVHEPLGNVVLEAWAHALPVVATRSQGPLEIIENETDALLVDISEPHNIADGIASLIREGRVVSRDMGEAGLKKLREKYSADVIIGAYKQLYDSFR